MRGWIRILSAIGVVATFLALGVLHGSGHEYFFLTDGRLPATLLLASVTAIGSYALGLPDVISTRRGVVAASLLSSVFGALSVSAVALSVGVPLIPRSVIAWGALSIIPWHLLCWRVVADADAAATATRILAVVNPLAGDELAFALANEAERSAELVARADIADMEGTGRGRPLAELVADRDITMVVLDQEAQLSENIVAQVADLHAGGLRVRSLSMFMEEWIGKVPISELERTSLFFDVSELHRSAYPRIKRVFDLLFCVISLPPLVALGSVVWLANAATSRGPLLFRQQRVGKGGEPFEILKFRTMQPNGDSHWTEVDDDRITPVGRLLRRSHLDELPQVVNILRGEISLVGPRPEQVDYVEELNDKLPFYNVRHIIRPGLTGWAQLKLGYTNDLSGAAEKLQYELFYLRHQGLGLDARIIIMTLRHLFQRGGM